MVVKFDDKVPIYLQIMDFIKEEIITGKVKGGDKLVSVRELSQQLRVNPNTVQRAYQELEREGLTYTQRGMGNFVSEDKTLIEKIKKEMSKDILNSFVEGMLKLGFDPLEIVELVNERLEEEGK